MPSVSILSRPRWLRRLAAANAVTLAWSLALSIPAQALARETLSPKPRVGLRVLSPADMIRIVGAGPHGTAEGPNSGDTYSWEASVGHVNTGNGNKLTQIPIVRWTARGGLPIAFTLAHNSQSTHNSELGLKWTHSLDLFGVADGGGNVTFHWGDDLSYVFTKNVDGSYSAPTGIHDKLVKNADSTYTLTRPDQTVYHYKTNLYCDSITDPSGNATTLAYNAGNYVTVVTDPTGRTLTLGYDTSNRINSVTDPLSRQWTLSYDTSGKLQYVNLPVLGGVTYKYTLGYDANANITSLTTPGGRTRTFSYLATDNSLTWQQDAAGNKTTFAYSISGATVTDPNSNVITITYTSGRVTQIKDALGYHEDYQYDTQNNKTQVTDKRGFAWASTFDSMGNVLTSKDPYLNTTTTTYNAQNRPLTITDPLGNVITNTYDSAGIHLLATQTKNSSSVVVASASATYTTAGLLWTKTGDHSLTTTYGYNANGDLTSVTTPLSRVTGWTVDGLGMKTSRTDAMSRTTTYTLDNWGRTTAITYPSGPNKTFTYEADGLATQFTDGTGTTNRAYDADGRLTSETVNGVVTSSYTYDGAQPGGGTTAGQKGLLSTLKDANGRVLTYAYTGRNQLYTVSETAGTTTYSYDAGGLETGITNPNSTTVTEAYDNASKLTSVTNKTSGGTVLSSFSYGYDTRGLRTSVSEADGSMVGYGYDGAGRLTSETRTGTAPYSISYALDKDGNRLSQTSGGVTTTFTYDNDTELQSTSGAFSNSYGYNANGEQTSRTVGGVAYTLSYDFDGQLTSITQGANTTTFAYDAMGRRVSRTAGAVTTTFQYEGAGILLEKQGASTTATYTYGNALIRKDGEFPLFDGLGSQRTVTNVSQSVTATLTTSAFGPTVASTGTSASPYRFAASSGYRSDGDAGLIQVGARYYDPQTATFTSRDSFLDQKPYLYCEHNPVNATDPSGHQALPPAHGLPPGKPTIPGFPHVYGPVYGGPSRPVPGFGDGTGGGMGSTGSGGRTGNPPLIDILGGTEIINTPEGGTQISSKGGFRWNGTDFDVSITITLNDQNGNISHSDVVIHF